MSLKETYSITWAEFCIRTYGYNRRELDTLKKIRLQCYANFLTNWTDPKKTPPTIEKYWRFDNEEKDEKELQARKERFLNVAKKFYSDKK